jgi:hypothetical protein
MSKEVLADDCLLTTAECAALLRIHAKVLHRWRGQGRGPAYCRIGGLVFYRRAAIVEYIRSCERAA